MRLVGIIQEYTVLVALTDLRDSTTVLKFLANTEKRHIFDYAKKEASIVYRYDDIIYDSSFCGYMELRYALPPTT